MFFCTCWRWSRSDAILQMVMAPINVSHMFAATGEEEEQQHQNDEQLRRHHLRLSQGLLRKARSPHNHSLGLVVGRRRHLLDLMRGAACAFHQNSADRPA